MAQSAYFYNIYIVLSNSLYTFVLQLIMQVEMKIEIDIEISKCLENFTDREDERFAKAIEHGIKYQVVIEELAAMCCQSISTFKRKFRARYSMSPHKWFTQHKLELAYRIINERDVTVAELTKICGFNNTSHFIAAFRKYFGISPARLSRQLRQTDNNT